MIPFVGPLLFLGAFISIDYCDALLVDELKKEFFVLEDELWDFVLNDSVRGYNNSTDDPDSTLLDAFYKFDQKVRQMPKDILYGLDVVRKTPSFLFLYSDLRIIHDLYDKFRRVESIHRVNDQELESGFRKEEKISQIIDDVLNDPKNNVNKTILAMYERTFLKDSVASEVFQILSSSDFDYFCKNYNQPIQQVIYNLYNTIALADLKGYVMMQYSYMAQRLQQRGNFTEASILAREEFEKRIVDYWYSIEAVMRISSRKLWKCDPKVHVKGVTYEELTALVQGHIENEVDMNPRGTCKDNCQAYPMTKSYGCYDGDSNYCKRRKTCSGRLFKCKFVESHMSACISPMPSPRRYEYIEYDSGRVYGKKKWCYDREVNSWYRWFVHCSYCFCLCDQQGLSSDRYFNLRPVMADVANNMVVTGLRIVKNNRIIHLQIQEGKLLPYGYINQSTVRWVPVDDYKITGLGVRNGIDFHTMKYEDRTLFMDDLKPPETDHVITGVRFTHVGNTLRLEINVRGFDFKNGTLSKYPYDLYGVWPRQNINIDDSDIPTNGAASHPNWDDNKYIEFTHSSIGKDAAQTTVPFFDTQPVASYPAVPLSGAGIYYKGNEGYGGFVAPVVTTYDFSRHIVHDPPTIVVREDPEDVEPESN